MTTTRPQPIRLLGSVAALALLGGACSKGGGGGGSNTAPTIVSAAFAGAGATPQAGDSLLLFFSEDVQLVAGKLFTDADAALSGGATLGAVAAAPTQVSARTLSVPLGTGVSFAPGTTTIALTTSADAVADLAGKLGTGGTPVVIATSDGVSPTIGSLTLNGIQSALNGTGAAGGTLQVPPNGWTVDLAYSDNGTIDTARTQVTASVAVGTSSGSQSAGTDLRPFLTQVTANNTTARYQVPSDVTFPQGNVTLTCIVVDATGLASAPATFAFKVKNWNDGVRPFETSTNASQVWYLDLSRDVESFTTGAISGGVQVTAHAGADGTADFLQLLTILGLQSASPTVDVNAAVVAQWKTDLLAELASLYSGVNVTFTFNQPAGSFGSSSSVAYNSLGYSQISIAGSPSTSGTLGIAIFDPNNSTQNNDTLTDFAGQRLGIFLFTIVDDGLQPPSSSAFRLTFSQFVPSLAGTPMGNTAGDDTRLAAIAAGSGTDVRGNAIAAAIAGFARFTAVVLAHECGHSMGLVMNGAQPTGLYGNDPVNFPGSTDGHIKNAALFPAGAINVMSPELSYSLATNPATAFNSLNIAYLRERVIYGN